MKIKQRIYRLFCAMIVCLAAIFGLNPSANAAIWFVDGGVMDCDNLGNSWPNAFKYLQDALNNLDLALGDDIWVKAGTYNVDQSCANEVGTGDRTETFQMVKGVFLLGGFNGTELFASERDSVANITILRGIVADEDPQPGGPCDPLGGISCFVPHPGIRSCDDATCCRIVCDMDPICCISGEQNGWDQQCVNLALQHCGEAYHVVTAGSEIDDPEQTVIDGFTIRDGWANGSSLLDRHHGGGMLIKGEPSVVRCTIRQNTASTRGAGMSITGDIQPWIINCTFEDNPGDPANPGDQQVFPTIGGGLANSNLADPILTNCLFVGNVATGNGGGIFTGAGVCTLEACARITLINCTVAFNTAGPNSSGGGLYAGGNGGSVIVDNSIFWDNIPNQIDGIDVFDINYSDVQGGWPGTGNINVNPLFVVTPDDLRLTINSLCIDAGNENESVIPCDFFDLDTDGDTCAPAPEEATPDLDLIKRVLDGDDDGTAIVDMGSYEFIHPNVCPCPDACPADLNGDCVVGVKDLLILLGNWGPCNDCGDCPADFVVDCVVGVKDLLFLLGSWGNCPCDLGPPPLSHEEVLADACLTEDHWEDFVDVMGDPTASQEDKDNYLCWMSHYLEGCSRCSCAGALCPGPDPFDD